MPGLSKHPHGVHAGSAFGLLAAVFVTVFGTALSPTATLSASGDTLAITWTITV